MSELVKDLHVSALRYVGESISPNPPENAGKYKRISIPYNPNRHCLGYIEGPAASLTKNTRNDRGYITKLWRNVENSSDFQEGMKNATIVGELDHPEERIDYSLANGAVILTDWEIREDEGIVWARFAILDNQRGKDLLAYVKFGTVLGVSSRGLGDEIIQDGRTIIDPDTYEFYCFDVVAFPAAECARQSFVPVEALNEAKSVREAFSDRVILETSKCSTKDQLIELKNVVESTSVADKDKLVEAITDKISSLPESAGNERTTSDDDEESNDEKRILLSNQSDEIKEKDSKIESLQAKLSQQKDTSRYFRRVVQEQRQKIEELENATACELDSLDSISRDYEVLKSQKIQLEHAIRSKRIDQSKEISSLRESLSQMSSKNKKLCEDCKISEDNLRELQRKLSKMQKEKREYIESLENELKFAESTIEELKSSQIEMDRAYKNSQNRMVNESNSIVAKKNLKIKSLQSQLQEASNTLSESAKAKEATENKLIEVTETLHKSELVAKELAKAYVKKASTSCGLKYEAVMSMLPNNFTISDVDKIIESLSDKQRRFDSLPISVSPISARIVEQKNHKTSDNVDSFVVKALSQGNK